MTPRLIAVIGVVLLLLVPALAAGELDLTQHYLLLATKRTSTMQKELSEAAAVGYRVVVGCRTGGDEFAMLLEKIAQPPEVYEYLLLATTLTSTMQKELDEAAARSFRVLPSAMMGSGSEVVVLLEKPPGPPPAPSQYMLLATTLTGTLQKEMTQAAGQGYELVGMVRADESAKDPTETNVEKYAGENMVILERPAQRPDEPPAQVVEAAKRDPQEHYLMLATERTSTMQKEMEKAASRGYRVRVGSPSQKTEIMMLLEKAAQSQETFQYKLLATNRPATIQKELNETARKGFRLLPQTVVGKRGTGGGWALKLVTPGGMSQFAPDEIVAVMEKAPGPEKRYNYLVLDTQRTSTMQKEITQAVQDGYAVVAMSGSPEQEKEDSLRVGANLIVILEKEPPQ